MSRFNKVYNKIIETILKEESLGDIENDEDVKKDKENLKTAEKKALDAEIEKTEAEEKYVRNKLTKIKNKANEASKKV